MIMRFCSYTSIRLTRFTSIKRSTSVRSRYSRKYSSHSCCFSRVSCKFRISFCWHSIACRISSKDWSYFALKVSNSVRSRISSAKLSYSFTLMFKILWLSFSRISSFLSSSKSRCLGSEAVFTYASISFSSTRTEI